MCQISVNYLRFTIVEANRTSPKFGLSKNSLHDPDNAGNNNLKL